jgi:hypothetical protein
MWKHVQTCDPEKISLLQEIYLDSVIGGTRPRHVMGMMMMMKRTKRRKLVLKTLRILIARHLHLRKQQSGTCAEKTSSVASTRRIQELERGQEKVPRR